MRRFSLESKLKLFHTINRKSEGVGTRSSLFWSENWSGSQKNSQNWLRKTVSCFLGTDIAMGNLRQGKARKKSMKKRLSLIRHTAGCIPVLFWFNFVFLGPQKTELTATTGNEITFWHLTQFFLQGHRRQLRRWKDRNRPPFHPLHDANNAMLFGTKVGLSIWVHSSVY